MIVFSYRFHALDRLIRLLLFFTLSFINRFSLPLSLGRFGHLPHDRIVSVERDMYHLARKMHYLRLHARPDLTTGISRHTS